MLQINLNNFQLVQLSFTNFDLKSFMLNEVLFKLRRKMSQESPARLLIISNLSQQKYKGMMCYSETNPGFVN